MKIINDEFYRALDLIVLDDVTFKEDYIFINSYGNCLIDEKYKFNLTYNIYSNSLESYSFEIGDYQIVLDSNHFIDISIKINELINDSYEIDLVMDSIVRDAIYNINIPKHLN